VRSDEVPLPSHSQLRDFATLRRASPYTGAFLPLEDITVTSKPKSDALRPRPCNGKLV
ncbi:hypothetical protein Dimus_004136, partial [Dionaea muscipula]